MSNCLVAMLGAPEPRRLIARLRTVGVTPDVVHLTADDGLPEADWDGIALVGGPVSPYDERTVSFHPIGLVLAGAVARQIPTLGIGGGGHLLARALGARPTTPRTPLPPGIRALTRTAHGRLDRLFRHAPPSPAWVECSGLAYTDLPVGSHVLAVDESGLPQAVRFGPGAWGFQGHPEMDADTVEACRGAGYCDDADEAFVDELAAMTGELDEIGARWDPMLEEFGSLVAARTIAGG